MKKSEGKKLRKIGPYILLSPIGKGSYSIVYEAKHSETGVKYAVKQISLVNIQEKQLERIHMEINVLSIIKHQNIVSLIDYKQTSKNLYLIFEHCKYTDLDAYIKKYYNGKLPESQVQKIMAQIKNAFILIRQHKIVHRDLKLANILVTDEFEIKLADFGFAKGLNEDEYFSSAVGTPLTMAPEILEKVQYNQKCDIWSLGIIIYQMLFGANPFFKQSHMTYRQIKAALKQNVQYPFEISHQAKDLISRMLVYNPKERIGFEDFFEHGWLHPEEKEKLDEMLRCDALKMELQTNLLISNRSLDEKKLIIEESSSILSYSVIEFTKNYIENEFTLWVNLAKKIMSLPEDPSQLTPTLRQLIYLALSILISNIDQAINSSITLSINHNKQKYSFENYTIMREFQTGEMSQFSKRLPNFVLKSKSNMIDYLSLQEVIFSEEEKQMNLFELFYSKIISLLEETHNLDELKILVRIKPWDGPHFDLKIESLALSNKTIGMMVKSLHFKGKWNNLTKKCSSLFKVCVEVEENKLWDWLQMIKEEYF